MEKFSAFWIAMMAGLAGGAITAVGQATKMRDNKS
jgi:hypothetical protein